MKLFRLLSLLCLVVMLAPLAGCGASFARTGDERAHMYKTIIRSEWAMAKDDVDAFNMSNRRSRLTRWH